MANVIWAKCYGNNRDLVRIGGEAPRAQIIKDNAYMHRTPVLHGRFYLPKTRMKRVLRDTTQNTCSWRADKQQGFV